MRIGFVTQRCGREVNGGAESVCLQLAQRLGRFHQTEVLTTCALDYMRWENWYPAGLECLDTTSIRRFPVDCPRDVEQFNRLSQEIIAKGNNSTLTEQEGWMRAQGPMSESLFAHLCEKENDYDIFIFFGYLYATTYFGLQLVADRALLLPFAHDEWPIHLSMWDHFFSLPRRVIFSTDAERRFLQKRFASVSLEGPTIGIGISAPNALHPSDFRQKYDLQGPFLLYAGRIDASKGCDELSAYFLRYQSEDTNGLKLVLIGTEATPLPFNDDVIYLGFVSDKERWDAMAACDWLVMPSRYESFSLSLLEAWAVGRPAIVNAASEVLVDHCRKSNGGLWYNDFNEWCVILGSISEEEKSLLGSQGRDYVRERYSWPRVEQQYTAVLSGN